MPTMKMQTLIVTRAKKRKITIPQSLLGKSIMASNKSVIIIIATAEAGRVAKA
jgi:hypothetical protein